MIKKLLNNKLLKNGGLYLFGNLFNKAIAFLTVPIFTRLLTTAEYGIVSTYTSWVSIFTVIVGLNLGNTIRNAFVDHRDDVDGYISSIFSLSFVNFLLIFAICFCANLGLGIIDTPLLVMCLFESFGAFIVNSLVVKYMMEEEAKKRTMFLVLPNLLAAILSVIMILLMKDHKEYGRIIPGVIVTCIFGLVIFCKYIFRNRKLIDTKYWKYALPITIPLVFHGLSSNILSTSDRTIITVFRSASETGIYSVTCSLVTVSTVITSSIESVWIPYFTKNMLAGNHEGINRNAKIYIELCTIIFCGIIVVAPEVLVLFASSKYASGVTVIAPIVLATYFQYLYSLAVNTEYYYKKTSIIATNTLISAVINLVLNFIFIPQWGALAAAFTTAASYFVSFMLHYRYCRKLNGELFPFNTFAMPLMVIVLFTIFQYVTIYHAVIRWVAGLLMILLYTVFVYIRNREVISALVNKK